MSEEKRRSRSKEKQTGIPLSKSKLPKAEKRSRDVSNSKTMESSRSKSKTSTITPTDSKKHVEKKSKPADDKASKKHHKTSKSLSSKTEKHNRKSEMKETKIETRISAPKTEKEQNFDDEYNYEFDYEFQKKKTLVGSARERLTIFESDEDPDDSRPSVFEEKKRVENGVVSPVPSVEDLHALSKSRTPPSQEVPLKSENEDTLIVSEKVAGDTPLLQRLASRRSGRPPDQAPQHPAKTPNKRKSGRLAAGKTEIQESSRVPKRKRTRITICTYNAPTLASDAAIEDLMMQASMIGYDVIAERRSHQMKAIMEYVAKNSIADEYYRLVEHLHLHDRTRKAINFKTTKKRLFKKKSWISVELNELQATMNSRPSLRGIAEKR
ncbi:hypothetical protein NECAME_12971 [Necator americanus]|uniref:Uncharacterized protein n=1 Tax=Necator americanus TaxID=51031 RepID=W2SZM6_NECAM|nr:hypothetical protein NECAME_12971 [Necator americanus]ETN74451.1 hypothetical protein NECAME_12971 [Necator americanus]